MTKQEIIEKYGVDEYERRKIANRERMRKYDKKHYYETHKEHLKEVFKEYGKKYKHTIKGRAVKRSARYRSMDKKKGYCIDNNITADYLVERLFPKGCAYCGETDPMKLGADRIDNSKPHTPDNVVCSCGPCNINRKKKDFFEYFFERYMDSILE